MPPYAKDGSSIPPHPEPEQHTAKSIAAMKKACLNARDVLAFAGTLVKPGVTTDEIDRKVHFATLSRGIYPSPFNYAHFPKSLCTSVNEVVCHGIPDKYAAFIPSLVFPLRYPLFFCSLDFHPQPPFRRRRHCFFGCLLLCGWLPRRHVRGMYTMRIVLLELYMERFKMPNRCRTFIAGEGNEKANELVRGMAWKVWSLLQHLTHLNRMSSHEGVLG